MSRPSSTTERELIQEQLTQAKKTLARLRQISDSPTTNGEPNNELSYNGQTRSSSRSEGRRSTDSYRFSTAARDNLVQALGYQVSKLEDDLKSSLLSYFEQVERQKEDLINSFNVMQKQLLNHQQTCQEQTLEAVEKDAIIRDLKEAKQQLENEVERLTSERNLFDGLDLSLDSLNSETFSNSPSNYSGYASDKSELSEKLLHENAKLREILGHRDDLNHARLERKVDLQNKLCHSYDKDIASKDLLIKRLKAENKGLQCDVQCMQEEVLRVNAGRLNAEQDKTKLQQENHFKEEQILALREQLAEALDDREEIRRYQRPRASNGDVQFGSVDEDLIELQHRCENYKKKLHDKEKNVIDMKREQQELLKGLDSIKKELAEAKQEGQRMKKESERLQRENADRDIQRLSTESSTKACNSKISQLKDKLARAEFEIKDLQRKCEEAEKREADLSQEVLSNLEKYTQTEQELYSTKKELAQLRGYNESHDRHKDQIQRELVSARENTARLEKELRAKNYLNSNDEKLDDLESENRQLREDLARLDDELNRSKYELNQLDNDMESLREQCSIQKVRLEGQETMITRKDERIKELQDELVELHNQNDALMDELLQNNRQYENLKMSKRLAEQEAELIKAGKVPRGHRPNRDNSITPDSGYYENQRHDGNGNSSENVPQRRHDTTPREGETGDSLLKELHCARKDNAKLEQKNIEIKAAFNDIQKELKAMKDQAGQHDDKEKMMVKKFKDKENDLYIKLDDLKEQLSEVNDQNADLKNKIEDLENKLRQKEKLNKDAVVVTPRLLTFNDQIDALESAPESDLFSDFDSQDKTPVSPKMKILNIEGEGSANLLAKKNQQQSYNEEQLIDFDETIFPSTEADAHYATGNLQDAGDMERESTKKEIEQYEAQIQSISADKQEMEAEIEQLRNMLDHANEEREISKQEKDGIEMQRNKEAKAKDDRLAGMEKELNSSKAKCKELNSKIDELNQSMKDKDKALKSLQSKLEKQGEDFKSKHKEMQEMSERTKEDEYDFEVTKAKLIDLEHEIEESQEEKMDILNKNRELQREKRNLEEDIDLLQREKNKLEKKAKEFENEKEEIAEKYEETKRNIKDLKAEQRKLQEEKDDLDYDLNELLKQKNREIKELIEDLELSENKYEDLKATWDSSTIASSDMKNDLLRVEEECTDLTNKNEQLYEIKKELAKDLESKEEVIKSLKNKEEDLRNGINNRERAMEKLRETVENLEQENIALQEETNELRKSLEFTNDEQNAASSYAQKLENDLEKVKSQLQESQEKLSLLEEKYVKTEAENDVLNNKLSKMERRCTDLQKRDDVARTELIEAEKKAKVAEKKAKELTAALNKSNDDLSFVQNKLTKAESRIASLEEEQTENEEQQKILQRKFIDATNELNDLSLQNKDQEDRQKNVDKRITDLRLYNEEIEAERDDLEFTVKELKKKLEKQKKKVQALEDELLEKQKEKDTVQQELDLFKRNASDNESEQNAYLKENEKLKKEMLQASKKVMDLEAENDAQKENIEELEKLLDQKRATVLDLEDNVKDTSETVATLQVQNDEDKRLIVTLQEDNANLEKMLEKQRQLSEGYKGSLAQKDAEISKLAFSKDDAEDALQLLKKDFVRREGVNKANQQELEEVEKQLADSNKKLQDTRAANEQLLHENERLQKELDSMKKRLIELDSGILPENFVSVLEVEPLSSRKSSSSSILSLNVADNRIKTLDEKLSKAQNKVTDLENELSKEIRKHEIDCIKTRPTLPYSYGKRSGFYDVSGASNSKYGVKKPESSDSEVGSDPGKSRESHKAKKSMDSNGRDSLDREDKESPRIEVGSSPLQSPAISVTSYDFKEKQEIDKEDQAQTVDSLRIQLNDPNDSFSEASSGDDKEVFDYSVGNLNDLLSEMNDAEKQDPILQKFLNLDPEGTSSPRDDDTFDSIEPTYLQRRQRLSLEPFDTSASDITTVTEINEPARLKTQSLINLESKPSKMTSHPEEPGVYDNDQPSDVIDPFSTPFDIPNWEDEFSSSFDSTKDLFNIEKNLSGDQVLVPVNVSIHPGNGTNTPQGKPFPGNKSQVGIGDDKTIAVRERDSDKYTERRLKKNDNAGERDSIHNARGLDNDADNIKQRDLNSSGERDLTATKTRQGDFHSAKPKDTVDGKPHPIPAPRKEMTLEKPTSGHEEDHLSDEEPLVFRKPSEIIKQLENASFTHGRPGMKPPRPKKGNNPISQDEVGSNKPQPKQRINTQQNEPSPTPRQRIIDIERADKKRDQLTSPPKQILIDLETGDEAVTGDEDRRTAIGRQRVLKMIAAFEHPNEV